jgi:hypothetical protein
LHREHLSSTGSSERTETCPSPLFARHCSVFYPFGRGDDCPGLLFLLQLSAPNADRDGEQAEWPLPWACSHYRHYLTYHTPS